MNPAVSVSRQQIESTLGAYAAFRAVGDDLYVVKQGSALVMISIVPWGEERAIVRCVAQVVKDPRVDGTLAMQLLRLNAVLRFGAFAWVPEGNLILFLHSILGGEALGADELIATVRDVALVADEYDDKIIEKFGGRRMADLIEEEALKKVLSESPDAFALESK